MREIRGVNGGTPSQLRELNDRTAMGLLLEHGPLTRNQLCELSGLSLPTASQIMQRMETSGLVEVAGYVASKRGPSAASYTVCRERILGVAINFGRGVVQSTVVDAFNSDQPIIETALPRSARDRDPAREVREAVVAACGAADLDMAAVRFTCVAVQSAVDSRADGLSFVEALPGWPRHGVRQLLEAELGGQVVIENDVNLAAIAERRHGAGRGAESFALMWIGEGLGLAVDLDGVVLRGSSGRAGEIGYLPVPQRAAGLDPEAKDLQSLVGASGLLRISRTHGIRKRNLHALLPYLIEHADQEEVFVDLAPRIAAAVTSALAVVDPERVVLGGPTGTAGGVVLAEHVQSATRNGSRWSPDIVTSAVMQYPVLKGARELLIDLVRDALINEVSAT